LCGEGAYGTDIIQYGPTYDPSTSYDQSRWIPAGATIPAPNAAQVSYDNGDSALTAGNVQDAIDALAAAASGTAPVAALGDRWTHGLYLATAHNKNDSPASPYTLFSVDGKAFQTISGPLVTDNASPTYAGDPTITYWNGKWWLIHQFSSAGRTKFTLWSSPTLDFVSDGTEIAEVSTGVGGAVEVYPPSWVRNKDGTPYLVSGRPCLVLSVTTGSVGSGPFVPYTMTPSNDALTSWNAASAISWDGPANTIDMFCIYNGTDFELWYKSNAAGDEVIEYATSSTWNGTYAVQESGDWAGWKAAIGAIEAPSVLFLPDGRKRVYMQHYTTSTQGIWWSDSTDGGSTFSSPVKCTTDFADDAYLAGMEVTYIPGMFDHERDPDAHPGLGGGVTDIEALITSETDTSLVYAPDGAGGVTARAEAVGSGSNLFVVDPGTPDYGSFPTIGLTSKFGIDGSGVPYYNAAGVTSGEEAALMRDPDTGAYLLRSYGF
jgi:hypothetical protein